MKRQMNEYIDCTLIIIDNEYGHTATLLPHPIEEAYPLDYLEHPGPAQRWIFENYVKPSWNVRNWDPEGEENLDVEIPENISEAISLYFDYNEDESVSTEVLRIPQKNFIIIQQRFLTIE